MDRDRPLAFGRVSGMVSAGYAKPFVDSGLAKVESFAQMIL
jgi:hypothetical protein